MAILKIIRERGKTTKSPNQKILTTQEFLFCYLIQLPQVCMDVCRLLIDSSLTLLLVFYHLFRDWQFMSLFLLVQFDDVT